MAFLHAAQQGVERLVKGEGLSRDQAIDAVLTSLSASASAASSSAGEAAVGAAAGAVDAVEVRAR